MKFDLHIHSKYSYDSLMSPEKIIKISKKIGLDGIAVTDHNTIKGGIDAFKHNKDDFTIIVGSEIKTEFGDLIGLFLNEEITTRKFYEVVDEIKSQGGVSILAHPYRQFNHPEEFVEKVDFVEGFNARSTKNLNNSSQKLAKKFMKPVTSGSDAHSPFEIGHGLTFVDVEIEKALRTGKTKIGGVETNYLVTHGLSVGMEVFKKFLPD